MGEEDRDALSYSIRVKEGFITIGPSIATCFCGKEPWCSHITDTLKEYDDDMLDLLAGGWDRTQGRFSVPLVPSYDLWVPVLFETLIENELYKITLDHIPEPAIDTFLCVVSPWESLQTIRSAMVTWHSRHSEPELTCISSSHTFKRERELKAKINDVSFAMANDWYLMWERKCMPCAKAANLDYSDLVPDDEPTGRRAMR